MGHWYTRPVFFSADVTRAVDFYCNKLKFTLDWQHEDEGELLVAQVSRYGFELILNLGSEKAGAGRVFISLEKEQELELRAEIKVHELALVESYWGMPTIELLDPDGNELFFSPP